MVHFLQIVLYKFLHGGTRRIHGERLLLLQNLRDSSVPSVLIPKICKEAFSLIWTMPTGRILMRPVPFAQLNLGDAAYFAKFASSSR
jgi:hypothetical protein